VPATAIADITTDLQGEWLGEKHGTATRRSWRVLHLGVDAGSGQIVASTLTPKDVDDASQVDPLLDQVAGPDCVVHRRRCLGSRRLMLLFFCKVVEA